MGRASAHAWKGYVSWISLAGHLLPWEDSFVFIVLLDLFSVHLIPDIGGTHTSTSTSHHVPSSLFDLWSFHHLDVCFRSELGVSGFVSKFCFLFVERYASGIGRF